MFYLQYGQAANVCDLQLLQVFNNWFEGEEKYFQVDTSKYDFDGDGELQYDEFEAMMIDLTTKFGVLCFLCGTGLGYFACPAFCADPSVVELGSLCRLVAPPPLLLNDLLAQRPLRDYTVFAALLFCC